MKGYIWVPIALLLGLIVGAVGPRSELRKARQELTRLREQVKETDKEKSHLENVLRLLKVPESSGKPRPHREPPPTPAKRENPVAAATGNVAAQAAAPAAPEVQTNVSFELTIGPKPGPHSRHGRQATENGQPLKDRIDEAVELWRVRSDMARNTFVADAGLSPEQSKDFDVVLAAMNLRLRDRIAYWADHLSQANVVAPETGMRMMNDLTGVLVFTYDEMDRKMPAGWREKAGESANLVDFIDPSVATPLIGVEDKFRTGRQNRHGDTPEEDWFGE